MLKNIFWSLVLLTMATFTMIFGEGFITPVQTPTPTAIIVKTATTMPKATSTALPPTVTKVPTNTATSIPRTPTIAATSIAEKFSIQAGTPIFMVNFVHTTDACNWRGVAGQVFDNSGKPLLNYVVKVAGTYNGAPFNKIGITGMVAGSPYGVGGYEIGYSSNAAAKFDLLTIQVFDAQGNAVTNQLPFKASSTCTQNLVIINFKAK